LAISIARNLLECAIANNKQPAAFALSVQSGTVYAVVFS